MDALKRTLIEKAGHDFGFEYTVSEAPASLTLGSAKHPLRAEVSMQQACYQIHFCNAKPLLISELNRDFYVVDNKIACSSVEQLASIFKRAASLAHSLPNQAERDFASELDTELNKLPGELKNTEVERIVRQRVGQNTYRKAMLEYWGGACAVTGIAIPEVLRASHALPWSECETDTQRLDVFNGLLLSANLDALFDKFLISFDSKGYILISDRVTLENRALLGLDCRLRLRWVTDQHEEYLSLHRARV